MLVPAICAVLAVASFSATASPCDYAPSKLVGAGVTGAGAALAGAASAAGAGLNAAGFYTITHAATGATMLASTAGGASAAGTVGIMGGTAGVFGTASAVLMSPFVIIPGAVIATGVAAHEGAWYLAAKKEPSQTEPPPAVK